MRLGNHCASGKDAFLLCSHWERKQTPVFLDVIILTYNMGMTKEAFLAADFGSVIGASLQLLDSHAAIYVISQNVKSATVRYNFTPRLREKPFTMFFVCQKHYCSMCSFMDNSQNCNVQQVEFYFPDAANRRGLSAGLRAYRKRIKRIVCDCSCRFLNLIVKEIAAGESLVKMCITLTDMILKSALRITKSDCLMCYDVNRYNTLHSISIAQNNKALCLQFTVQRFVSSCAYFQYFWEYFCVVRHVK